MKRHISLTALTCFLAAFVSAGARAQTAGGQGEPGYRVVLDSVSGASHVLPSAARAESDLFFETSDARLQEAFDRAKRQAMAFVFEDDPVGPWYEAAEPGREAFCMRDVARQCMGAHALGLARHNLNMLRRFAENISESKDWCSYWEMDRHNRAAPVDYQSDAAFWYNLPANFDILDACYRMYLWTGDLTYIDDPVFLNYYDRTVTDYVRRWGLGLDQVMERPRLLNVRGIYDPGEKFQANRGIPGYNESDHDYILGVDVLAHQHAAYVAYARIQELRGDAERAGRFLEKAAKVRDLVNNVWWNGEAGRFHSLLYSGHRFGGRGGSVLLYRDMVDEGPKLTSALADARGNVVALYRYGEVDAAYSRLLEMTTPGPSRMEYPEVPYTAIGAIVNGTMGVTLDVPSALLSAVQGGWVEAQVRTLSGLSRDTEWAEMANLPIRANHVAVRHEGVRKTVFTNQRGPALVWHAMFPGTHETLLINGRPMKARLERGAGGREVSWVRITAGSGGTIMVEVPAD